MSGFDLFNGSDMLARWLFQHWLRRKSARASGLRSSTRTPNQPPKSLQTIEIVRLEDRLTPATLIVTTTLDSGPGSLRQAIITANQDIDLDVIRFDESLIGKAIGLRSVMSTEFGPSALAITTPITIEGSGQTIQRATGAGVLRLFFIDGPGHLTLSNLQLRDGWAQGGNGASGQFGGGGAAGMGGAIFNQGTLVVSATTFVGNKAVGGAGGAGGIEDGGYGGGGTFNGNGVVTPIPPSPPTLPPRVDVPPITPPVSPPPPAPRVGVIDAFHGLAQQSSQRDTDLSNWLLASNTLGVIGGAFGLPSSSLGFSLNSSSGEVPVPPPVNVPVSTTPPVTPPPPASPPASYPARFGEGGNSADARGVGGFGAGGSASTSSSNAGYGGGSGTLQAGGGGAALGGAIFNQGGSITMTDTTFAYNSAIGGLGGDNDNNPATAGRAGGGSALGAAIFNLSGGVTLVHTTIARNTLSITGLAETHGAIFSTAIPLDGISSDNANLLIINTIIANTVGGSDLANHPENGIAYLDAQQPNIVMRRSLRGDGANTAGIITRDPALGVLAYQGGLTPTMAPASNSFAVNRGVPTSSAVTFRAVDQRGGLRDRYPDLGSHELIGVFQAVNVPPILFPAQPGASAERAFVNATYLSILNRSATVSEIQQWETRLKGQPEAKAELIDSLWKSPAHRLLQTTHIYRSIFERDPSATERELALALFREGVSEQELVTRLLTASDESQRLSDSAYVQWIFPVLMGRLPTEEELSRDTLSLGSGLARSAYVMGMLRERDVVDRYVQSSYRLYLGRSATTAERNDLFIAVSNGDEDYGSIVISLLNSQEFWLKAEAAVR